MTCAFRQWSVDQVGNFKHPPTTHKRNLGKIKDTAKVKERKIKKDRLHSKYYPQSGVSIVILHNYTSFLREILEVGETYAYKSCSENKIEADKKQNEQ